MIEVAMSVEQQNRCQPEVREKIGKPLLFRFTVTAAIDDNA
jgi:hypothetical protein